MEYFIFAIRNLQKQKLRSMLTVLGIIIGITTIVSLMLLGKGMENTIAETFQKLGVSSIRVVPEGLNGPPTPELGLSKADAEFIATINGVEYVDQVLINHANVEYSGETELLEVISFDTRIGSKGLGDLDLKAVEGRLFDVGEVDAVLVGYNAAKELFDKEIYAKNSVRIQTKKFRVIGIFEKTGTDIDNRIMIPLETARGLFNKPDIVNAIVVKAQQGIDLDVLADRITEKLKRKRNNDDFKVYTPEQLIAQIQGIFAAVSAVLVAIAVISLIVGGIGIMNAMFTAVLERTREIGVMKAIGATNARIMINFLLESAIMGFIGGFLGCTIGFLIAYGVGYLSSLTNIVTLIVRFDVVIFLTGLFVAFIVGTLSGVIPAWRAAKLNPVDALRYE